MLYYPVFSELIQCSVYYWEVYCLFNSSFVSIIEIFNLSLELY